MCSSPSGVDPSVGQHRRRFDLDVRARMHEPDDAHERHRRIVPAEHAAPRLADGRVERSGEWYSLAGTRIGRGREAAVDTLRGHPELLARLEPA
jgi:hypothetical protein